MTDNLIQRYACFIASVDYNATATTPLVAVVGDSLIQALQVPFAESLAGCKPRWETGFALIPSRSPGRR